MIRIFRKINNPALKVFLQIFPLFVLFFLWKDFGDQIGNSIYVVFSNIAAFMSPAVRIAGQYILGLMVFLALWSFLVYMKVLDLDHDVKVKRFWRMIAHILTGALSFYCIFYFMDTLAFMREPVISDTEGISSFGLNFIIFCIGIFSIFFNIIIFNKSQSKKITYYD